MTTYQKSDMHAAEKMLRLQLEKLKKHVDNQEWAMVSSALRAIETECIHANRIAASLSSAAFLESQKPFSTVRPCRP